MRSHKTSSTCDRSMPHSLQIWLSTKSSISQLTFSHYKIIRIPGGKKNGDTGKTLGGKIDKCSKQKKEKNLSIGKKGKEAILNPYRESKKQKEVKLKTQTKKATKKKKKSRQYARQYARLKRKKEEVKLKPIKIKQEKKSSVAEARTADCCTRKKKHRGHRKKSLRGEDIVPKKSKNESCHPKKKNKSHTKPKQKAELSNGVLNPYFF